MTIKRCWWKEYFWSLYYSFFQSCIDLILFFVYLSFFCFIFINTNNLFLSFWITFLSILGGNQFSKENVLKVEKKMGYKIYN